MEKAVAAQPGLMPELGSRISNATARTGRCLIITPTGHRGSGTSINEVFFGRKEMSLDSVTPQSAPANYLLPSMCRNICACLKFRRTPAHARSRFSEPPDAEVLRD